MSLLPRARRRERARKKGAQGRKGREKGGGGG